MMKKYWDGDESLSKTFWLFWISGSLAIAIAGGLLAFLGSLLAPVSGFQLAFLTFLLLLLFNPYYIICWVSVWRSTKNSKIKLYYLGAKSLVALHVIYVTYTIYSIPEIASKNF